MKPQTALILFVLFLIFRKRQAVVVATPDYITRTEFNELAKKVGYLREELDAQYFG